MTGCFRVPKARFNAANSKELKQKEAERIRRHGSLKSRTGIDIKFELAPVRQFQGTGRVSRETVLPCCFLFQLSFKGTLGRFGADKEGWECPTIAFLACLSCLKAIENQAYESAAKTMREALKEI